MPTPAKPVKVLEIEKRSHRTKKELAQRKRAEAELLTGTRLKEKREVRDNPVAHKEFIRLRKLLATIGKNDDLYGETINRYCILVAECEDFQEKREIIYRECCHLQEVADNYESHGKDDMWKDAMGMVVTMQKNLVALDRQIQTKRKMLLDIEKENIMTIASSLRSIPKKTEKKKDALREALNG